MAHKQAGCHPNAKWNCHPNPRPHHPPPVASQAPVATATSNTSHKAQVNLGSSSQHPEIDPLHSTLPNCRLHPIGTRYSPLQPSNAPLMAPIPSAYTNQAYKQAKAATGASRICHTMSHPWPTSPGTPPVHLITPLQGLPMDSANASCHSCPLSPGPIPTSLHH